MYEETTEKIYKAIDKIGAAEALYAIIKYLSIEQLEKIAAWLITDYELELEDEEESEAL